MEATTDPGSASSSSSLVPGESAYHESSQFRHWRFSSTGLHKLRQDLNRRSIEVAKKNNELEKQAQEELKGDWTQTSTPAAYLTVADELCLVRFYCQQISQICRRGFALPEQVEATAISYLKRFYLKNSVMEWHPKAIMPTALFLAAKTTNYPVAIEDFLPKMPGRTQDSILGKEFLVAQSLGFEFWDQPRPPIDDIQKAVPKALLKLTESYSTDAEFIYTPSQIGLACLRMADRNLVDAFLELRYSTAAAATLQTNSDEEQPAPLYGIEKTRLIEILEQIAKMIESDGRELGKDDVKPVDKRLKGYTNPEKVPGTALYEKRKREKEQSEAAAKAAKNLKSEASDLDSDMFFGGALPSSVINENKSRIPLSPKLDINGSQQPKETNAE
ncbi:hypothetical protein I350_07341 [Cryptococcus amylolentus CBS 6273]|uniref:Cyclin-like domain-containing protein n=1 Tax=Cryptococcus amylolentus CBS 6273 TaxID=1296118 RepID=A0A1E3JED0_9TREE|nr:hypothetical protein I350_07341 [Cryptococcus amylolentus CBS 6273]